MNPYQFRNASVDPQSTSGSMLPYGTLYEDTDGARDIDLRTLHLKEGRLFIDGEINRAMATRFVSAMVWLAEQKQDVKIYLNSPGGEVNAGLLMYDIMQEFPNKIEIYCTGLAASMGAVLLAGGQEGRRYILPHSQVMIHEPLINGGFGGSASSVEKTALSILETKSILNGLLAKHTGKTEEEINAATAYDNYMGAYEALEFGICDSIHSIFS